MAPLCAMCVPDAHTQQAFARAFASCKVVAPFASQLACSPRKVNAAVDVRTDGRYAG